MDTESKRAGTIPDGGAFTLRMIDYIKANFADVLGADVNLLDSPNGLDILRTKYNQRYQDISRKAA
jgi:hypothetical protein